VVGLWSFEPVVMESELCFPRCLRPESPTPPSSSAFLLVLHGFFVVTLLVANAPLEKTMGIVQKIFYFHVPCAWLLMLSTFVCALAVWPTCFADQNAVIV